MYRLAATLAFSCTLSAPLNALGQTQATASPAPAPIVAASTSPDTTGKYTLREGEDVHLKFAQDLSSKTATEGDPVTLVLTDDLKVNGVTVAKEGAKAFGEVTNAKKSGMMGKAGELSIRLEYLKVGDTKVRLRGTKGKEGESGTTSAVVLTVLFGPIGLIKHGKNIEIKQGSALTAYVSDDIALPPVANK
ncbi:hypothetical protein AB4Y89_19115 [Terriglobus sp. 2YAB30_2]|uniref:hypothetical protein n=1 Tax=unclassified Terriglobus TaxID=2628988 RepID=UPI003F9E682B